MSKINDKKICNTFFKIITTWKHKNLLKSITNMFKKIKSERNYALLSSTKSAMSASTCLDEESSNISSTSLA